MRIDAGLAAEQEPSQVVEGCTRFFEAVQGASNCVIAPRDFEHTEAKEIFFGALKACDIASSLVQRIRCEGDVLHHLTADG